MEFPEIHFGGDHPKLHSYKKHYWQPGEKRLIEFYPNHLVPVTLLYSSDPKLYEQLSTLIDGKPISIDLEWSQPSSHSPHPIELFQFSSSKGTIIVASHDNKGYDQLNKFLHSSTFFGKGMSCDKKKLFECLGENFDEIEDIEKTRLTPNGLPINFESLTEIFLGQGTAKFKDHKVQRSDWSVRPLSILQILYGAHDSYAMLQVYRKIVEKYGEEIKVDLNTKNEKDKKKKKEKPKFEKKVNCHFIDLSKINFVVSENNNEIDELLSEDPPSFKEQLFKIEKAKNANVKDEDSCFIEHSDELVPLLLPSQPKEKRNQVLERICLAADLLLRGIVSVKKDGKFRCNICFKFLKDPVALIQHCSSRHLNGNEEEMKTNHNLDSKDVYLHFLIANKMVKCPFKTIFEDSELKKITFEEEEDDSDSDSDDSDSDNKKENIVPMTYNESDGIICCICNKKFDSAESLRNHCWLLHYDLFVKLVTGKGFDKGKEEENKKLHKFGVFCIKQLNCGAINTDNLSINCKLCEFNTATADKFFNHVFFRHQQFAIVNKKQYANWPIRYSEFLPQMEKQVQPFVKAIDFDELDSFKIYNKKENKCIDCNVSFKNDQERDDHYMKNHLIYITPQISQD